MNFHANFKLYFQKNYLFCLGHQKWHLTWVANRRNEHCRSQSLYPSGFGMIDITCISGANVLKFCCHSPFTGLVFFLKEIDRCRFAMQNEGEIHNDSKYIQIEKID